MVLCKAPFITKPCVFVVHVSSGDNNYYGNKNIKDTINHFRIFEHPKINTINPILLPKTVNINENPWNTTTLIDNNDDDDDDKYNDSFDDSWELILKGIGLFNSKDTIVKWTGQNIDKTGENKNLIKR